MPQVRAIFISDVHLGTAACQAARLVDFLREYQSEHLFMIGDIVDFWAMSRGKIHWSREQNTIVQKLLRRARHGEQVIFIPGNHDEALREYIGTSFGDIRIEDEYIHTAADGRRYLLTHGDAYDQVTRHHKWVAILGDMAYGWLVRLNGWLSWLRRTLRRPGYWSLAGYAKRKVKTAVNFIFDFEDSVIHHVRERGLDGVICGHIHWPMKKDVGDLVYLNCGDWVDSCTAIVEHMDGRMELIAWGAVTHPVVSLPKSARAKESTPDSGYVPIPAPLFDSQSSFRQALGAQSRERVGTSRWRSIVRW